MTAWIPAAVIRHRPVHRGIRHKIQHLFQIALLRKDLALTAAVRVDERIANLSVLHSFDGILCGPPVDHVVLLDNEAVSVEVLLFLVCKQCSFLIHDRDDSGFFLLRPQLLGFACKLGHLLRCIEMEACIETCFLDHIVEEFLRGSLTELQRCVEYRGGRDSRCFHQRIHRLLRSRCSSGIAVQVLELGGNKLALCSDILALDPCHPGVRQRKEALQRRNFHHFCCTDLSVIEHSRDIDVGVAELVHDDAYSKGTVIALVQQLCLYKVLAKRRVLIGNLCVREYTELLFERRTLPRLPAGCFEQRAFTDD